MSALERLQEFFDGCDPRWPVFGGIDPGVSGAFALVAGDSFYVADIPVMSVATTRKTKKGNIAVRSVFDHAAVHELFGTIARSAVGSVGFVVEKGSPRPQDNALTAVAVGVGFGMWPLYLHGLGFRVDTPVPGVWKKKMGLLRKGADKDAGKELSRQMAQQRWPGAPLTAKSHHNRAEALLLAEYARSHVYAERSVRP